MTLKLVPVLALLVTGPALADPLARIEGVSDASLRAALETAIGEREAQAGGVSSALRDARTAADRARRLLRSRGYYAATLDPMIGPQQEAVVQIAPGP